MRKFLHLLWQCFNQPEITNVSEARMILARCSNPVEFSATDRKFVRELWLCMAVKVIISGLGFVALTLFGKWFTDKINHLSTVACVFGVILLLLLMLFSIWPWRHSLPFVSDDEDAAAPPA